MMPDMKMKAAMGEQQSRGSLGKIYKLITVAVIGLVLSNVYSSGMLLPVLQDYEPFEYVSAQTGTLKENQEIIAVQVTVAQTNVFNANWDGMSIGGMIGPVFQAVEWSSPSDLAICVLALDMDKAECAFRRVDDRISSFCPNSHDCDWQIAVPTNQPYSIVVLDLDRSWYEGAHDYVDAVLVGSSSGDEVHQLDELTRLFINVLSPTAADTSQLLPDGPRLVFDRKEAERRERTLPVLVPNSDAQDLSLSQSYIALFF